MPRIVTALVFLLAAAALGFFYTLPAWQKFQALGRDNAGLAQMSAEFDKLIANRDTLLDQINSITKDNLDRLDNVFPRGPHTSELLVALEALTVENNVALGRVDLVSPDTSSQAPPALASRPASQPRPTAPAAAGQAPRQASGEITGAQELPFSIQITGTYLNFKKFLASVEKNLRLIDMEGVSFGASGKGDEALGITLKAKTYYQ